MELQALVDFWTDQHQATQGQWVHPGDEAAFDSVDHTFNLDFPISPFLGNVLQAPVLILGANAGYDPVATPTEFPSAEAIRRYVDRTRRPAEADWSLLAKYYGRVNYGPLLADGRAALINACPYRSPRISSEPQNRALIERLPSTAFARRWLLEAVLPLAQAGRRLVVAKRPGLWKIPAAIRQSGAFVFDPAPVSPQITGVPWQRVLKHLSARDGS